MILDATANSVLGEPGCLDLGLGGPNLLGDNLVLVVMSREVWEVASKVVHHTEIATIRSGWWGVVAGDVVFLLWITKVGKSCCIQR